MSLKVYNTLSRELEEFVPIDPSTVSFYQCGPTVYSRQHIGNMRAAVIGDIIRKSLTYLGYNVKFTRNVTDVGHLVSDEDEGEDKMAKGAKKEGLTPEAIARKYTDLYHTDLKKLNVDNPDFETFATEYVNQMAEMVQIILDKGFAYATEKAIYFEVEKFPDYNKLNRQKLEKNIQGAGHGDVEDEDKRSIYDFAVWFFKAGAHANALQTWKKKFKNVDQKIEEGFPGWHIECSAMSKATLGDRLDFHMGGIEHIQVHHTNEIAQSESANGVKYVNYWLHHEMLQIDGGKMSKSLGNVYSLDDLEARGYKALYYRYFLLNAHYRSQQNFTWEVMDAAKVAYERLASKLTEIKSKSPHEGKVIDKFINDFKRSLEDDFNIPAGLAALWEVLKSEESPEDILATVLDMDKVLGLGLKDLKNEKKLIEITDELKKLLDERAKARSEGNWDMSDKIRTEVKEKFGYEIKDTQLGQELI